MRFYLVFAGHKKRANQFAAGQLTKWRRAACLDGRLATCDLTGGIMMGHKETSQWGRPTSSSLSMNLANFGAVNSPESNRKLPLVLAYALWAVCSLDWSKHVPYENQYPADRMFSVQCLAVVAGFNLDCIHDAIFRNWKSIETKFLTTRLCVEVLTS